MNRFMYLGFWIFISAAPAVVAAGDRPAADLKPAFERMSASGLLAHIKTLSSDEFEGRGPGTIGETRSVEYISKQFRELGLKPGNPDGTYFQKVPLVGFSSRVEGSISVGGKRIDLKFPQDWVAVSRRFTPEVRVEASDIVFVGYGVVAPEYDWDDYKGLDVRGKTIVMLVNDPAVPDPADPSKLDPAVFKGKAMTYYGRWTYKYEIASEKGAAAAIIIHETGPAGYPFEVVSGSWGRENFDIARTDGNRDRVSIESWITEPAARLFLAAAGQDFDALKKAAAKRDFRPVPLAAKGEFRARNTIRTIDSLNVAGLVEGGDPAVKNEYVVYTAHWDHLGKDESRKGDQIFNGAVDNASGVASILEIAKGFKALAKPPRRSIVFIAVTAEEKGLLGAKYYAEHPLYPLEKTLANINIDGINVWGKTTDIVDVGLGMSDLDDLLADVASRRERSVMPDAEPEKGFFYRSDHFEFAKLGVPALDTDSGTKYPGKPADFGIKKRDEYTRNDYHKPTDEIKPGWDLSGAVDDLELLLEVGVRVADGDAYPAWKKSSEFRARREAALKSKR